MALERAEGDPDHFGVFRRTTHEYREKTPRNNRKVCPRIYVAHPPLRSSRFCTFYIRSHDSFDMFFSLSVNI